MEKATLCSINDTSDLLLYHERMLLRNESVKDLGEGHSGSNRPHHVNTHWYWAHGPTTSYLIVHHRCCLGDTTVMWCAYLR
ncbi:hypothetical protein L208DRAFT_1417119 [Tricholoma matsutake]|nr:hypothetical protein L208DRAFT_1417119 [Tricholoma matsutake 945]